MKTQLEIVLLVITGLNSLACAGDLTDCYTKTDTWSQTLVETRAKVAALLEATVAVPETGPWYVNTPVETDDMAVNHLQGVTIDVTAESKEPLLRWRRHNYEDGRVHDLRLRPGQLVYLVRTITVDKPMRTAVTLSCDDAMEVRLNGKAVFHIKRNEGVKPGQHEVIIDLQKGKNEVLMKVNRSQKGSRFYFNLAGSRRAWQRAYQDLSRTLWQDFPVEMDWWLQDDQVAGARVSGLTEGVRTYFESDRDCTLEQQLIGNALREVTSRGAARLKKALASLASTGASANDARWLALYARACRMRRQARLEDVAEQVPQILFIKRHPVKPSFFGYTEGQSDAQHESHFDPGSALCLLTIKGPHDMHVETLLDDPTGVIRDMDVSWDGQRILYAHKKSRDGDDYHLYEMDV
ncbi:MAG: hypothetical protein GY809_24180, partial [Planctomycetes bacterium]|nr:hypothetical protein [Planctomycetota bacterium]